MSRGRSCILLAGVAVSLLAGRAAADQLVIDRLEYKDCKIEKVDGPNIYFRPAGAANSTFKPLSSVSKIRIDSEPKLNEAEDAYAAEKWPAAAAAYLAMVRNANTPKWLKLFCASRLREAAEKAGDIDAAAQGYIEQLQPGQLQLPKEVSMPAAADPAAVKKAITTVDAGLGRISDKAQRVALLSLKVKLCSAIGDTAGATAALMEIRTLDPSNPLAAGAARRMKLGEMKAALQAKDYEKVLGLFSQEKDNFTEDADQAEALLYRADALAGKAGNDKDKCKDAALEYIRIVAAYKNDVPAVPDALWKAGELLETRGGDMEAAWGCYDRLAKDFAKTPQGAAAVEKLKKRPGTNPS